MQIYCDNCSAMCYKLNMPTTGSNQKKKQVKKKMQAGFVI